MHVEMRPITSIRPYNNNPRHNDAAVDAVAASI
jgi:site-specific DNA-methyltransferase (adenine-specific)